MAAQVSGSRTLATENGPADLVVVGGGLCGASAAYHAARRGKRVVLLEAEAIGTGMTQQSAGHVMTGFLPTPQRMNEQLGVEATLTLQTWAHQSKDALRRTLREFGFGQMIQDGYLLYGQGYDDRNELENIASYWRDKLLIGGVEILTDATCSASLECSYNNCVLYDPSAYTIERKSLPYITSKLIQASAANILENTRLLSIKSRDGVFLLETSSGSIAADSVFVAAGAASLDFLPELADAVVKHKTLNVVTRPLLSDGRCPVFPYDVRGGSDSSNAPDYWTVQRDGSLMFGVSIDGLNDDEAERLLIRRFAARFPVLKDVAIQSTFAATIDGTNSGLPILRQLRPRLWVACGFSGLGLAQGFGAGILDGVPWGLAG